MPPVPATGLELVDAGGLEVALGVPPLLPGDLTVREREVLLSLDPAMLALALEHDRRFRARVPGGRIRWNSGRRSPDRQAEIVSATAEADTAEALASAGLSGFGVRQSLHLYGLAYDAEPAPKTEETWRVYGEEAEALGLEWGGRYRRTLPSGEVVADRPHVELPGNADAWRQLGGAGVVLAIIGTAAVIVRRRTGGE